MGLLAKIATKKRVAPASGPLNESLSGAPWTTTSAIPTGALVRSVVFSVAIAGVRSTNAAVAGAFIPTFQSHVWLESDDSKTWQVVLGIPSRQGAITADWVVKLVLNTQVRTATVATTHYRTVDGALLHAEQHDQIRGELLRAMSLGVQADADAEERVTSLSLQTEQPFENEPPDPFEVNFGISTSLDERGLRDRLRLLGHRVRETTTDSIRWGLGLPSAQDTNEVTLTLGDRMLHGHGRVAAESGVARRIAAADLRSFIARALFLVKDSDGEATFRGPKEWAP